MWRPSGSGSVCGNILHSAICEYIYAIYAIPGLCPGRAHASPQVCIGGRDTGTAVCLRHCRLLLSHHDFWLIGAAPGCQQPDLSVPHNSGITAGVNPFITGTKDIRLVSCHQSVLAVSPQGYLREEQLLYRYWVILGKCFQKLSLKD